MIGCMVQCARECVVHVLFGTHAPSAWLHWIICLRCFSVCFCLVKMSVYVKTQRHVEASNRGEKIDTQRFAVPCFREQPQRFFFYPWNSFKSVIYRVFWIGHFWACVDSLQGTDADDHLFVIVFNSNQALAAAFILVSCGLLHVGALLTLESDEGKKKDVMSSLLSV